MENIWVLVTGGVNLAHSQNYWICFHLTGKKRHYQHLRKEVNWNRQNQRSIFTYINVLVSQIRFNYDIYHFCWYSLFLCCKRCTASTRNIEFHSWLISNGYSSDIVRSSLNAMATQKLCWPLKIHKPYDAFLDFWPFVIFKIPPLLQPHAFQMELNVFQFFFFTQQTKCDQHTIYLVLPITLLA